MTPFKSFELLMLDNTLKYERVLIDIGCSDVVESTLKMWESFKFTKVTFRIDEAYRFEGYFVLYYFLFN